MKKRIIAAGIAVFIAAVLCGILMTGVQLRGQLETARTLKKDLQALGSAVMSRDMEGAENAMQRTEDGCARLRESLERPIWKTAALLPAVAAKLEDANTLLDILERTTSGTLRPLLKVWKEYPALSANDCLPALLAILRDTYPQLQQDVQTLEHMDLEPLDSSGKIRSMLHAGNQLLTLPGLDEAFFGQAAELLNRYPLDSLSTEKGFYIPAISAYLAFAESALPIAEKLPEVLESEAFSEVLEKQELSEWMKTLKELTELYRQNPDIVQLIHAVLDQDKDVCYLLAALNPAEIRACGGFPSFVSVTASNAGFLRIGGFTNINYIFPHYAPYEAAITEDEYALFLGSMSIPWDSSFCPDFERVAGILALSFQAHNGQEVDGVVGVSSVIIQKLLKILGDIPLSDGTVLTGENATRLICYELNFRNYTKGNSQADADAATDALYNELAKNLMKRLLSGKTLQHLPELLDIAKESFAERSLMLWMKDEEAQEIVKKLRWDGGLNTQEDPPEIGVFLNCDVASKLGWFVDMDIRLGQPSPAKDNCLSYPMAVTITNTITQAEVQQATWYLLGKYQGTFIGSLYIFAPSGGTVKNFHVAGETPLRKMNYHQRDLLHAHYFYVPPGGSVTVTCDLVCGPGVTAKPTIVKTPTLQGYRSE